MESTRRTFFEAAWAARLAAAAPVAAPAAPGPAAETLSGDALLERTRTTASARWWPWKVDLAPARWIWMPSGRVLPNTFVLFRREIALAAKPERAWLWIAADSRYRLTINGQRVAWGPAPCDPRWLDADPVDIAPFLRAGANVIGVEVLFYGHPEGTWPGGRPGLLLLASIDGQTVVSDANWAVTIDRAHHPGQAKRWFLRSLQEVFDARSHPAGWDQPGYQPGPEWIPPQLLDCASNLPASCARGGPWANDTVDRVDPQIGNLRLRQIPPVSESMVEPIRLAESGTVEWRRDPEDWFDFRVPGSFGITRDPQPRSTTLPAAGARQGSYVTYEFREQVVGFPGFTIDAPEGAIIEMMWQEAHDPQKTQWLDSQFFNWTRVTCREGENHFEAFDYESLRWLQLHVRNSSRPVTIREVHVRRREFPWPHEARIRTSEPALQRLFDASVNTLNNAAIETVVDGMARERQQYSGDCGHQIHAIRYAFGETRIGRRYLRTFSEGITKAGYFLDSWPAADRLARIAQKEVDAAFWGPLLDHSVGFAFDNWNHYFETGEREAVVEPYPRLLKFADALWALRTGEGVLPVENLGIPTVWIDHIAYQRPRHKQCAFTLYAAAMYTHALASLADLMGDPQHARTSRQRGAQLLQAAVKRFWSPERGLFVANLPWLAEEQGVRLCDRSLATSVLFDQCPGGNTKAGVQALADCPKEMGFSYPANQGWRLWALGKAGRADVIVKDLRERWAPMRSVIDNNTLQEDWEVRTDSTAQWSHCALVPLYIVYMELAGIRPLAPGFSRVRIRPQLADLRDLDLVAWTPHGPITFTASAGHIRVEWPGTIQVELALPKGRTSPKGTSVEIDLG